MIETTNPNDINFMNHAIRLARLGIGYTSPNPPVGAVIVKDHEIIGYGYHFLAGTAHAERWALQKAGHRASGATLYVTLEPCNHHGRTPPCTEAIIQAGIQRVVFGCLDPNVDVTGGGAQRLRDAGLEVVHSICSSECAELLNGFIQACRFKRPYTILKVATTLDGRVGHQSQRMNITSAEAREWIQQLRATCDGILVGSGTVVADRPALQPRTRLIHSFKPYVRCILDTKLKIPMDAPCLDESTPVYIFHALDTRPDPKFHRPHITLVPTPSDATGLDLGKITGYLADHNVRRLLVEPGPRLLAGFLRRPELIDELWIVRSNRFEGDEMHLGMLPSLEGIPDTLRFQTIQVWSFKEDILCRMLPILGP